MRNSLIQLVPVMTHTVESNQFTCTCMTWISTCLIAILTSHARCDMHPKPTCGHLSRKVRTIGGWVHNPGVLT